MNRALLVRGSPISYATIFDVVISRQVPVMNGLVYVRHASHDGTGENERYGLVTLELVDTSHGHG